METTRCTNGTKWKSFLALGSLLSSSPFKKTGQIGKSQMETAQEILKTNSDNIFQIVRNVAPRLSTQKGS